MIDSVREKLYSTFKCPLCKGVLYKPVVLRFCGHTYCKPCLMHRVNKVKACPRCNRRLMLTPRYLARDYHLQRLIYRLQPEVLKSEIKKNLKFLSERDAKNILRKDSIVKIIVNVCLQTRIFITNDNKDEDRSEIVPHSHTSLSLQIPAQMNVGVLLKFLHHKILTSNDAVFTLMYEGCFLSDTETFSDVLYSFLKTNAKDVFLFEAKMYPIVIKKIERIQEHDYKKPSHKRKRAPAILLSDSEEPVLKKVCEESSAIQLPAIGVNQRGLIPVSQSTTNRMHDHIVRPNNDLQPNVPTQNGEIHSGEVRLRRLVSNQIWLLNQLPPNPSTLPLEFRGQYEIVREARDYLSRCQNFPMNIYNHDEPIVITLECGSINCTAVIPRRIQNQHHQDTNRTDD